MVHLIIICNLNLPGKCLLGLNSTDIFTHFEVLKAKFILFSPRVDSGYEMFNGANYGKGDYCMVRSYPGRHDNC